MNAETGVTLSEADSEALIEAIQNGDQNEWVVAYVARHVAEAEQKGAKEALLSAADVVDANSLVATDRDVTKYLRRQADRLSAEGAEGARDAAVNDLTPEQVTKWLYDWPACSTYPNLECVCRGGLKPSKATCTRKRTGDLTPVPVLNADRAAQIGGQP